MDKNTPNRETKGKQYLRVLNPVAVREFKPMSPAKRSSTWLCYGLNSHSKTVNMCFITICFVAPATYI